MFNGNAQSIVACIHSNFDGILQNDFHLKSHLTRLNKYFTKVFGNVVIILIISGSSINGSSSSGSSSSSSSSSGSTGSSSSISGSSSSSSSGSILQVVAVLYYQ